MKFLPNLFQTVTNNPINSKTALEEKNLRRSKIGGGESRVGMTAVKDYIFFLDPFPNLFFAFSGPCLPNYFDTNLTSGLIECNFSLLCPSAEAPEKSF